MKRLCVRNGHSASRSGGCTAPATRKRLRIERLRRPLHASVETRRGDGGSSNRHLRQLDEEAGATNLFPHYVLQPSRPATAIRHAGTMCRRRNSTEKPWKPSAVPCHPTTRPSRGRTMMRGGQLLVPGTVCRSRTGFLKEARSNWEEHYGSNSVSACSDRLGNLEVHYLHQGRLEEAEMLAQRSTSIMERELPPDDPMFARALLARGYAFLARGRYAEAVRAILQGYRNLARSYPNSIRARRHQVRCIGECFLEQRLHSEAESWISKSITLADTLWGYGTSRNLAAWLGLARARMRMGHFETVDSLLQLALATQDDRRGSDSPYIC